MSRAAVAQVSFTRGSSIRCHFLLRWLKYSLAQVAQILVSTWLRFSLTFTNEITLDSQVCVYYDAWSNDNDIDPMLSLVYSILEETASDYDFKKSVDCINTAAALIDTVTGRNVLDLATIMKERDPLSRIKEQKEIHDLIEELLEYLLYEQGNRLVVFIDELDRCKPSYAIQLLERIKHYFANDRITFVFSVNVEE